MNAVLEIEQAAGEELVAIVFGQWGWNGYGEPEPQPVPEDRRGVLLSRDEAMPLGEGWSCYGGYGAPDCYALRAWTESKVLWITQYDGSTGICAAERNPTPGMPDMPGG